MPRKSQNNNETSTDSNDKFQSNIKKWIDITQQIITLEKQLEKLREEQMLISHNCVNLTLNLSDEIKINTLVSKNTEVIEKVDNKTITSIDNKNTNVKTPIRRKRRTKAEIEKERQEVIAAKQKPIPSIKAKEENEKSHLKEEEKEKPHSKEILKNNKNGNLEENSEEVSSSEDEMSASGPSTELDSLSSDSSSESSESCDEN